MRARTNSFTLGAAGLASLIALQHAAYAAMGGVHPNPVVAWLLVLALVLGAVALVAAHNGATRFAWPGLALLWLPLLVTFPAALASIGGWLYVLPLIALTGLFLAAAIPPRAAGSAA